MLNPRQRSLLLSSALALGFAPPGPLAAETLADALVTAYQTSPLVASNRAALRTQDEAVPLARADRRPQISADAQASYTESTNALRDQTDLYSATLNATLLVFDSGQTAAAVESARYGVAAARASLRDIEQSVLLSAVSAYVDVIQGMEFVRIAESDVSVLEEQLRAANNRFEVGEVTRTDVSLTEAQLESSRANLADSRGTLQLARQDYLAAVGTLPQNLSPTPPLPELPGSIAAAEAIALRQNPAIVSAQFIERGAVADFDRAIAAGRPQLSLFGSLGYDDSRSIGQGDDVAAQIGLQGSVPIYSGGRNSSLVRQAQSIVERRKFELQETGRNVIEQVNAAWTQIMVARASIVANQRQFEAATTAFEGVREEARLGARSTLDVLDADQDALEAEAQIVVSRRNEYVAAYSLLQAMGLLTVDHLDLGVETYDPEVNFARVRNAPVGGYDTSAVDRIRARWQQ